MTDRDVEIQKRHYDAAQPFFPRGFSVGWRNPGHWDVYARAVPGRVAAWMEANPGSYTTDDHDRERAFRIRGGSGDVIVYDERWNPHNPHPRAEIRFDSVARAMEWIAEQLMQEQAVG